MTVVTGLTSASAPRASSHPAAPRAHGGDDFAALVAARTAEERPADSQVGERRTSQASGEQRDDAAGQDRDCAGGLPVCGQHGASHSGTAAAVRGERQDDGSSQGAADSAPAALTAEVAAGMAAVDPAAPPVDLGTPPPSEPPAGEPLGTPALASPDSTAPTGPSPAAPTSLDEPTQATGQPASVPVDAAAANDVASASAPTSCAAPSIAPATLNAAPSASATPATAEDQPASAAPQPTEAGSPPSAPADSVLSNLTLSGAPAASPTLTANATASPDTPAQPVASQVSAEVTALMSRADGTHRIRLRLSPEALGEVSVVLTLRKGAVEVTLGAGARARLALEESSGELHRLLRLAGAQTTQVVVKDLADSSPTAGLAQGHVGGDPGAGDASLSRQLGSGRRYQRASQRRAAADLRTDGPAAITTAPRTAHPRTSLDISI